MTLKTQLRGYHYTNSEALTEILHGGEREGDKIGLIPHKRFIPLFCGNDLPYNAHEPVVEGLLYPTPESWTAQKEFPHLWRYLMGDIVRRSGTVLLSFPIFPEDDAYVVDRAHMERELYKPKEMTTPESMHHACKKFYDSRIPALEYTGGYTLAQLAIWSPIPVKCLRVEWERTGTSFWQECLEISAHSR